MTKLWSKSERLWPNRKMIQTDEKSRGSHFLRSQLLFFLETPGAISRRCTGLLQPMLCCFLDTARVRDGEQGVGSRYIQIRIQLHHAAPLGDGLSISWYILMLIYSQHVHLSIHVLLYFLRAQMQNPTRCTWNIKIESIYHVPWCCMDRYGPVRHHKHSSR